MKIKNKPKSLLFRIFGVQSEEGLIDVLDNGWVELKSIRCSFEDRALDDITNTCYSGGTFCEAELYGIMKGEFTNGKKFRLEEDIGYSSSYKGVGGGFLPETRTSFEAKVNSIRNKYLTKKAA